MTPANDFRKKAMEHPIAFVYRAFIGVVRLLVFSRIARVTILCDLQVDTISVIIYKIGMRDENFFLHPETEWQRRYETLRASFVERLPAKVVADRFGYSPGYVGLLRHQFIHGKLDFNEPPAEGKNNRRRVDAGTRAKICNYREHQLSAGEITELLTEDGIEISIRTVERILAEEGYPRLPRRTRLKIGLTHKGANVPASAENIGLSEVAGQSIECDGAGVFLFTPFLQKLNIHRVVKYAGLPGTKVIPAINRDPDPKIPPQNPPFGFTSIRIFTGSAAGSFPRIHVISTSGGLGNASGLRTISPVSRVPMSIDGIPNND
jgi:transposase